MNEKMLQTIMIVEDTASSRHLLSRALRADDREIISAASGEEALELLAIHDAHLILMDIEMPGIDGFETTRRIKEMPRHQQTPVIFITARANCDEDISRAFEVGGADYIFKPLRLVEVYKRVAFHLERHEHVVQLTEYATKLEKLAEARAAELIHADRLANLGTMAAGIAHEINNPTTFISGNVQTLRQFWRVLEPALKTLPENPSNAAQLAFIQDELPGILDDMQTGVTRIQRIVDGFCVFGRKQNHQRRNCEIVDRVKNAATLCQHALKMVDLQIDIPATLPRIHADSQQIEQVLVNLMINACHAMERTPKPQLRISATADHDTLSLMVADNGHGLPESVLKQIWDPFFTTKEPGKGTGLGLAINQTIVSEHDGTLTARNNDSGGAEFTLTLPAVTSTEAAIA